MVLSKVYSSRIAKLPSGMGPGFWMPLVLILTLSGTPSVCTVNVGCLRINFLRAVDLPAPATACTTKGPESKNLEVLE